MYVPVMMARWNPFLAQKDRWHTDSGFCANIKGYVDIELGDPLKKPREVDSCVSFCDSELDHDNRTPSISTESIQYHEPIHMTFDFGGNILTKSLDYETFVRWDAMEAFAKDLEEDGFAFESLWDETEKMKVGSGDWDARVRPGWRINASFLQAPIWSDELEKDSESDSEDYESTDQEEWQAEYIDEYLDKEVEDWCLPRWRSRVEQEMKGGYSQEPSWMILALGCASMMFFIVAVITYTV
jgi:hypothetical protein